jgi:glycosyltransferase involved in cell wall biosynthesis
VTDLPGRKLSVLILHSVISPYRLPLFTELSKTFSVHVFFCSGRRGPRKWQIGELNKGYTSDVLRSCHFGRLVINPTIVIKLLHQRPDVYLIADNDENMFSTLPTLLAAAIRRKPVVVWNEHVLAGSPPPVGSRARAFVTDRLKKAVRTLLYRRTSTFVSMSGPSSDEYLLSFGVPPQAIHTGTQVMPTELLPPVPAAGDPGGRDRPYLLFLGYLRPEKGIKTLLDAYSAIRSPALDLVFAGSGPEGALVAEASSKSPGISLLGYVDGAAKAGLIAAADALVVPSTYEPWGMVVNESLYYGTPVLCSGAVSSRELLDQTNSLIHAPGDVAALHRDLEHFMSDASLRADLKRGAALVEADLLCDTVRGCRHFASAISAAAGNGVGDCG